MIDFRELHKQDCLEVNGTDSCGYECIKCGLCTKVWHSRHKAPRCVCHATQDAPEKLITTMREESGPVGDVIQATLVKYIDEIREQRDNLAAGLREALDHCRDWCAGPNEYEEFWGHLESLLKEVPNAD